ncbi:MAG: hypothetical protein M3R15_07245 [Acidobacteriota bacterium]|nr:hypothetical protein [Acidobacteriota bacterium]
MMMWKKFEPLWDWVIRARRISHMLPVLEGVLTGFGKLDSDAPSPLLKPATVMPLRKAALRGIR